MFALRLKSNSWWGETKQRKKRKENQKEQQLTMDNSNSLTSGTVLLRSVSLFLSNRRQSKQLKDQAQIGERKRRPKTLSKVDEQMGKLQPKVLESLKRKTHFNK
ncbi:CLUMA_CG003538, isoform A [Clunio marinus]|uniref:CLUMA_CG003538, isoform A n=1 Tax=Clunio marinus TaxID=568069 RepID=A0A1J1HQ95_9DIPT|nr:CLUMA_CG003538, isoform A [Clunio marinus]